MTGPKEQSGVRFDLETRHGDILAVLEHGETERATELCRELLDEYPGDVKAHLLMGDILAAREDWGTADQWYQAAEEMGGGPEATERRAAARAMLQRHAAFPPVESQPEDLQRRSNAVRSIFMAAGTVAVLALTIALVAVFSRPAPMSTTRRTRPTPDVVSSTPATRAGLPPGRPGTQGADAGPGSGTSPAARAPGPAPATPAGSGRLMTAPATDQDRVIAQAVSALTWPNGVSMAGEVSVMMDPYQGYCVLTFRIPDTLPEGRLYETVLQQAYQVVLAALAADGSVRGLTLRALYTSPGANRAQQTVQAFRANTTRQTVADFAARHPVNAQSLTTYVFATAWWNPAVPTGQ
ncbi:MAG: hypothetical protein GX100_09715 [candidate division WS1 bacterium]|nr:hypothetical protein [candidate division WS1 bacterium]